MNQVYSHCIGCHSCGLIQVSVSTKENVYLNNDLICIFFRIYISVGISSVLIVGIIASYISGPRNLKKINPDLISPVMHRFLPDECFSNHEQSQNGLIDPTTELFTLKLGENSNQVQQGENFN